ncbi:MAG: prepilin-type N-terminal cleavage/methylation domain-containing protein [Verrucomicrobiae bacterium]|nr:prepilin-type N-terminal cleavage/methylation domain-containing protein [Verrucomicrobiae bacterium]
MARAGTTKKPPKLSKVRGRAVVFSPGLTESSRTVLERKERGFTLIEMLVAITIIAVLAAVLAPSLSSAKERARRAQCMSNLHQIAIAQHAYAQDHDGWLYPTGIDPFVFGYGGMGPTKYYEAYNFGSYLGNSGVLYCPSRLIRNLFVPNAAYWTGIPGWDVNTIKPLGHTDESFTHYCINRFLRIDDPTDFILMYDAPGYSEWRAEWVNQWTGAPNYLDLSEQANHGLEGSNILYVDGHVGWQKGRLGPFIGIDHAPRDDMPPPGGPPKWYYAFY